jgi:hypothetical protein
MEMNKELRRRFQALNDALLSPEERIKAKQLRLDTARYYMRFLGWFVYQGQLFNCDHIFCSDDYVSETYDTTEERHKLMSLMVAQARGYEQGAYTICPEFITLSSLNRCAVMRQELTEEQRLKDTFYRKRLDLDDE